MVQYLALSRLRALLWCIILFMVINFVNASEKKGTPVFFLAEARIRAGLQFTSLAAQTNIFSIIASYLCSPFQPRLSALAVHHMYNNNSNRLQYIIRDAVIAPDVPILVLKVDVVDAHDHLCYDIQQWDFTAGLLLSHIRFDNSLQIHTDIATVTSTQILMWNVGSNVVHQLNTGAEEFEYILTLPHQFHIRECHRLDDNRVLIMSKYRVYIWYIQTNILNYMLAFVHVYLCRVSGDCQMLTCVFARSTDQEISVWEIPTGIYQGGMLFRNEGRSVLTLTISPNNRIIVMGFVESIRVIWWHIDLDIEVRVRAYSIAFSSDSWFLVTGGEGTITMWTVATGHCTQISRLYNLIEPVTACYFLADNTWLLAITSQQVLMREVSYVYYTDPEIMRHQLLHLLMNRCSMRYGIYKMSMN